MELSKLAVEFDSVSDRGNCYSADCDDGILSVGSRGAFEKLMRCFLVFNGWSEMTTEY